MSVTGCHLVHQAEGLGRVDVAVGDAENVDHLAGDDVLELHVPDGPPSSEIHQDPTNETMLTSLVGTFEQLSSGQLVAPSDPGHDAVTEE